MAPYSMDLRKRVARAWDAHPDADVMAAKYEVAFAKRKALFRAARPRSLNHVCELMAAGECQEFCVWACSMRSDRCPDANEEAMTPP
jgi:hypothetical protein